jgi:hypothetical protein
MWLVSICAAILQWNGRARFSFSAYTNSENALPEQNGLPALALLAALRHAVTLIFSLARTLTGTNLPGTLAARREAPLRSVREYIESFPLLIPSL